MKKCKEIHLEPLVVEGAVAVEVQEVEGEVAVVAAQVAVVAKGAAVADKEDEVVVVVPDWVPVVNAYVQSAVLQRLIHPERPACRLNALNVEP